MNILRITLVSLPLILVATTASADAEQPAAARPSPVGDRGSLEPLIGFGTNDYNFGVGARAGYTFQTPVYIGATFMWYSGETHDTVSAAGATQTKSNFYYPGMEFGYDIGVGEGRFLVRPYAGLAVLFDRERVSVNGIAGSDTSSNLMLYPGVTARFNVPNLPVYVGADTRITIPIASKSVSFQGFFVAGLSL